MLNILKQASLAGQQENFSLLTHHLQQLSLGKNGQTQQRLNDEEFQLALSLGLQVLKSGDFQEKWDLVKVLPKLGKAVIAPVISILEDEALDLEVRWFAGRILGQFDDPAVVMVLVKLLKDGEDEELAYMASEALANIGTSAVAALSRFPESPEARLLAVQALAHIHRPEVIEPLLSVVNDPSWEIRATAIETLSNFRSPSITPVLLNALSDNVAAVRKEAVIGLGLLRTLLPDLDLVKRIKPLLYDLNLEVCHQAAIALGRLATLDAHQALVKALQSPPTPITLQIEIVRAFSWEFTTNSLQQLQAVLREAATPVCREIISVLGMVESDYLKPKAAEILIDFCQSGQLATEDHQIKQTLAMSLGQLAQFESIPLLKDLVADSDHSVSLHAIAALKKFPL
ncbi:MULTISPECIES: HEAT repeat domain-containing protein [unclassified Moorena]|uniref:HEAT repeat domain-containing protein n=1 Tax=unclassified Moorena TaxID=2683338 RepID=UPI00140005CF|nr:MULTISPECIES: HEAT repeat domain-containing protein [unclassified Moorena]NEO15459.1 HEAT repeat domain-containing protein [Moorena sp. SIO3E8]NEQ03461.1 HEAT repeat domain-containing protein [Moorena sp. SIO3F7]